MKDFRLDLYRYSGNVDNYTLVRTFLTQRSFRYILYYRILREQPKWSFLLTRLMSFLLHRKTSIEIPYTVVIGKGFYMMHPYGITINSKAVIGDNFTIMKGATIGNVKSGKKVGSPVIGNNVYVGLNSTVVGGIHIGDNVMIAANTFVNFDVPDNSLVLGSPGVIHMKNNASEPYIPNSISNILNKR